MKITLQKLILSNFREVSHEYEFSDGQNVWSGPNGSGKTTLADAEQFKRMVQDVSGCIVKVSEK